jgi:hypothetical protein
VALRASPASAQECVRDVSRLIALAGPSVLAVDQIDTLLARSLARTDEADDFGDGVLEQVAHGLMAVRHTMRRTVAVVACLPARVSDRSQWQPTAPCTSPTWMTTSYTPSRCSHSSSTAAESHRASMRRATAPYRSKRS